MICLHSPVSGVDVLTLLGGVVTRDSSGAVVGAQATQMTWTLKKEEVRDAVKVESFF